MSPSKKKDPFDWWQSRIEVLSGFEKEATTLYSKTGRAYEVGPQAVSKLALFAYFVRVYSSIIKARFKRAYYIDLFAGSGLTRISTTGDAILGSAMLASRVPAEDRKFDRMILVEKDPESAKALRELLPDAQVIEDDVNHVNWDEIIPAEEVKDIPLLVLADPEGMDVDWATIAPLLKRWSDVVINYQVEGPRRIGGRVWDEPVYEKSLTKFYGTDAWKALGRYTDEGFFNVYTNQIRRYKDIVIPTKVRGGGGFFYYMVVAVRKTGGEQGWIGAVERARRQIEATGPDFIERALDVFTKRARPLDSFWDST